MSDRVALDEPSRRQAFRFLEGLSISHSLIYIGLLAVWVLEGPPPVKTVLGWAHGLLWIAMAILIVLAARKAIVTFRLAVLVAVVGGLGPFAGTLGFLWEGRTRGYRGDGTQEGAKEVLSHDPGPPGGR